jgi:putative transcription factor
MSFQDWKEVVFDKRGEKKKDESDNTYMQNQFRKGNVITKVKTAKLNSNNTTDVERSTLKKIDNEQETFVIKTVSQSVSKKISQARCTLKLTQKELAFKLSLPLKTIQDYESGKAQPNNIILCKIEKVLGVRVRD